MLQIKVYDKILDMIGRDATHMVGSRIKEIVGAKHNLNLFNQKLRVARFSGMTRIEVSICSHAIDTFALCHPPVRTLWHTKVENAIDHLYSTTLNDNDVIDVIYRKLDVSTLLAMLTNSSRNILAVGRNNSWLINCRTVHKRHFVGTWAAINFATMPFRASNVSRLERLAAMHSARGSTVKVYWLHSDTKKAGPICTFMKLNSVGFALPGCSLPPSNGITLPTFVKNTAESSEVLRSWTLNWPNVICKLQ